MNHKNSSPDSSYRKHNLPTWISSSTLVVLIAFIIHQAKWQEKVDNHILNKELHMTFQKKMEVFMPRVELDSKFESQMDLLREIRKDVKDLRNSK